MYSGLHIEPLLDHIEYLEELLTKSTQERDKLNKEANELSSIVRSLVTNSSHVSKASKLN